MANQGVHITNNTNNSNNSQPTESDPNISNASNSSSTLNTTMGDATDFDPETMAMLMANLPQSMFRAPDPRLQRAWQETERTDQITPLLKEELRLRILSKRLENGQPELDPDPATPKVYELTEEEKRKRERRKEQNRRAAKKCRERRKLKNLSLAEHMEEVRENNLGLKRDVARLARQKELLEKFCIEHIWNGHCHVPPDAVSKQKLLDYFHAESQEAPTSMTASTQTPYTLDSPTTSAGSLSTFGQIIHDPSVLQPQDIASIFQEHLPSASTTQGSQLNLSTPPALIPADPNFRQHHVLQERVQVSSAPSVPDASVVGTLVENRPNFLFSVEQEPLVPSGVELASSQGSDQSPLLSPTTLFQLSESLGAPPVFRVHMEDSLSTADQQPIQAQVHDHIASFQHTSQNASGGLQSMNVCLSGGSSQVDLSQVSPDSYCAALGVGNPATVQTFLLHSTPMVPNTSCIQMTTVNTFVAPNTTMLNPISPISPQSPSSPNLSLSPASPGVLLATEGIQFHQKTPYLQQQRCVPISANTILSINQPNTNNANTRSGTPKAMTSPATPVLRRSSSTISTPSPFGCSTSQLSPPPSVGSSPPFTPVPESPIFVTVGAEDTVSSAGFSLSHTSLLQPLVSPVSSNCSDSYSPLEDYGNRDLHNL